MFKAGNEKTWIKSADVVLIPIANFEHISHLFLFAVNSTVNSFACFVISRSSHPKVFCKKGLLKNLTKFTAKDLRQSLFLNKVAGLRPATLLRKRLAGTGVFLWISQNL